MTDEPERGREPGPSPGLRMSDADRERAVARLNAAVAEGRLTLSEFEERVAAVLRARTAGEVAPYLADLPAPPRREVAEWRTRAGQVKQRGRWVVPRRVVVVSKSGSVYLNFVEAVIEHPVVEVELDVSSGSVVLVLPPGATADIHDVTTSYGTPRLRVPAVPAEPHFVVRGRHKYGSLLVRYERHFWRWRW